MAISEITEKSQHALTSLEFANELDANNTISQYRNEFAIPTRRMVSGEKSIYGQCEGIGISKPARN